MVSAFCYKADKPEVRGEIMRYQLSAALGCFAVFFVGCGGEPKLTQGSGSSALRFSGEISHVLALGDSLAAGHQLAPDEPGHCCGRDGYADQLYAVLGAANPKLRLHVLGCGSETTETMIHGGGLCTYENGSQLDDAVQWIKNKDISLVTIDIGANDVLACLRQPDPSACLPGTFSSVAANLATIVRALRAALGPDVPLLGMNYYNPMIAQWLKGTELDRQTAIASQTSIVAPFNDLLELVYLSQGATAVADVETAFASADFTSENPTMVEVAPGTSIPLTVANICAYTWMCSAGDIHPNTAGYALIADTFLHLLP